MQCALIDESWAGAQTGAVEADIHLRQTAAPDEMEATIAALSAVAASAERVLRRPRRRAPAARTFPRLFDARPIDPRPDDCWRCDAASSADGLGLCPPCRDDLSP